MLDILIVEDDADLRELFAIVLGKHNYHALCAESGEEALSLLESHRADAAIVDVMMPGMSGFELVALLRQSGYDLPILMVTARDTLADKREGFRAGVDDYVVKPIDPQEMIWRIEALLRRARIASERRITVGGTVIDRDNLSVTRDGCDPVYLPLKEFLLLYKLMTSPERIFTRQQLMDEIWGLDSEADSHTLDVHMSRLRERLRDNDDIAIATIRGLGYKGVARA
ncbi:response regulator transcription factor [uncultured Adlercreutzia sp.]|uniref:response regulator transcription factor n=1 Tax=uncultured Adlercreutzia sp. TaxID=875803 RepID=UPI0025EB4A4D|nr:response regulator transcription factor [uncultured Adlercreutzia sp.]